MELIYHYPFSSDFRYIISKLHKRFQQVIVQCDIIFNKS